MSWKNAIIDYRSYLKLEKNLSENTISNYLRDIQFFRKHLEESTIESPYSVSSKDIQNYLQQVADNEISARSQARYIASLNSFFEYLLLEDRISLNPMDVIESPKIGKKLPDYLTLEEINALIDANDLSSEFGHRNKAILEMLYGCGLRVSELINLRLSDIFEKEGFIRVLGKGNKQRLVPIANKTLKELYLYVDNQRNKQETKRGSEDIVFLNNRGAALSRVMVFTIIKKLSESIGLKKKVSPHTFRHSFATHLLHNGADIRAIQLMLGHESITTTEIYTHLENSQLQETILKFHPRNK